MASQYNIIVQNLSTQTMFFYAFQKLAVFANSGSVPTVLSSSLACGPLAPNASSGAQLDFGFDTQIFVGAKSRVTASTLARVTGRLMMANARSPSAAMAASTEASAVQPIALTPSTQGQAVDNFSTLTANPLGLSASDYRSSLPAGSFGIGIPAYPPAPATNLYCGCAAINQDGSITLSSFITPLPNSQVYCSPVATYYVKVGNYPVGQTINYDTSQSAECDFTSGYETITVQYNNDGSYTTKGD